MKKLIAYTISMSFVLMIAGCSSEDTLQFRHALTGEACEVDVDSLKPVLANPVKPSQAGQDRDALKIEEDDIGVEGVELDLGDLTVTFTNWITKDEESDEFVGFTITTSSGTPVSYLVKTGLELHVGNEPSFLHPAGTEGPTVNGISYVDLGDGDLACDDADCCSAPDDEDEELIIVR